MTPNGQAWNSPGQSYWTVPQCEGIVGHDVVIHDWYATFPAHVEAVSEVSPRTGFVTSLLLTYQARDGVVTRAFSLNSTREITRAGEEN